MGKKFLNNKVQLKSLSWATKACLNEFFFWKLSEQKKFFTFIIQKSSQKPSVMSILYKVKPQ